MFRARFLGANRRRFGADESCRTGADLIGPRPSADGDARRTQSSASALAVPGENGRATGTVGQQLLSRLNAGGRVAMVLSTHDLNFAASLCRRLILVRDGRVLASGPTEDVLTPDAVRALYDVDADVHMHQRAGHLTVTPIART